MNRKLILCLGAFVLLLTERSFSQSFVQDISSRQSVGLEDFIKNHSGRAFSIRANYPQSDFERSAQELEKLYFDEVGSVLESKDSLSVSSNFKKLPRSLSRQYKKETKKLVKRLKRLNVTISANALDYIIEPRYLLQIEKQKPIAYVLSLEYILIDVSENKSYRVKL
jgi:hypothetical protein